MTGGRRAPIRPPGEAHAHTHGQPSRGRGILRGQTVDTANRAESDADAAAAQAGRRVLEALPNPGFLLDVPSGQIVWINAHLRWTLGENYTERLGTYSPERELIARRWDQFVATREPFQVVHTVAFDGVTHLLETAVWPIDPQSTPAPVAGVQFRLTGNQGIQDDDALDWILSWNQPTVAIALGEPMRMNRVLLDALGIASPRDLAPSELNAVAAEFERIAHDDAPGASHEVTIRGSSGPLRLLVARFAPFGAVASSIAIVSGFFAPNGAQPAPLALPPELSPRECDVVRLMLDGFRVPTIATSLYVSPNTVRNHLRSIFAKLHVTSQDELIARLRS